MHYVTGGSGPPLVLLHGWPQSWYEWRGILPALAQRYTVYAVDLPGLGDSEGVPPSYDKATLALYVHGLIGDELGLRDINLVAHDLGAGVGFQYAAQFPDEVARYAHLDYPLPGPALSATEFRTFSWHLAFHGQERVPEAVVADDVREYLELFFPQVAHGGASFGGTRTDPPFTPAQIDEFARTYSRPQVLTGGFELYRTLDEDERDNTAAAPITGGVRPVPVRRGRPRRCGRCVATDSRGARRWPELDAPGRNDRRALPSIRKPACVPPSRDNDLM
jgi:pimeloyl-ACP methyl ester carboxylesterase